MKVKFGDLTISQVNGICKSYTMCYACPLSFELRGSIFCRVTYNRPNLYGTDREIELPDKEVKNDGN